MSWRFVIGALALGLTVAAATTSSAPTPISDVSDRAVKIATMPCSNSLQSTSSGYVLDDELVVTVAHAIFETREFALRDASGMWHRPTVRYMDLERDLAILHVEGLAATRAPLSSAGSGDSVQLLDGAASGSLYGSIARRVQIRTEFVGDLSQEGVRRGYELDLTIKAGDSGAAILDDNANLIALVFARSTRRGGVTWATAVSEVAEIRDRSGVPSWECGPGTGAELLLDPLAEDRLA